MLEKKMIVIYNLVLLLSLMISFRVDSQQVTQHYQNIIHYGNDANENKIDKTRKTEKMHNVINSHVSTATATLPKTSEEEYAAMVIYTYNFIYHHLIIDTNP